MTDLNRLQLRQSEVREKINALIAKEALEDAERSELDSLSNEMRDIEPKLRAAIVAQDSENAKANDPAFGKVKARATLGEYFNAIVNKRPLEGAPAEMNREMKLEGNQVPWEMFVDPEVEMRAATQTSNYDGGLTPRPVIPRLFAPGVMDALGVRLDSVPAGETEYVILTSGPAPTMQAEGGTIPMAAASTFTTQTLKPRRIGASIEFSRELLASVSGIEAALRMDLVSSMRDQMNRRVLVGSGAPDVEGIFNRIAKPSVPTAVAKYDDFVKTPSLGVDGIFAQTAGDIGIVMNPEIYQFASGLIQAGSGESAIMGMSRVARSVVSSAFVPKAPTSNTRAHVGEVVLSASGVPGSHLGAIWQGVTLITDEVTLADKGEVRVHAYGLWDFYGVFRSEATKLISFKMQ